MIKLNQLTLAATLALSVISPKIFAVDFAVFGDVTFSDSGREDGHSQIALGQLDFFATADIDDKSRVFIEYVFENGGDGHGMIIDLERLWIARELNEQLTIAAGRFHTPLGHWNRTYHHGSFMQDSISRPFFLDFEDGAGGVLPVHVVGVMAWGSKYFSAGELSYEVFVSNGSSIDTDEFGFNASPTGKPEIEINDASDVNNSKSLGFRVTFAPSENFSGSLFAIDNDVAESGVGINSGVATGQALVDQNITGVDLIANYNEFDTLIEYYHFNNKANTVVGGDYTANAYFTQFGWRFNQTLKALLRFEKLSFNQQDSYFALLGAEETKRQILGLRYDLSSSNSLKLEISHQQSQSSASFTGLSLQWSFIVP
jgi:hypothetical protein